MTESCVTKGDSYLSMVPIITSHDGLKEMTMCVARVCVCVTMWVLCGEAVFLILCVCVCMCIHAVEAPVWLK